MSSLFIPKGYVSKDDLLTTQKQIKFVKDHFPSLPLKF